MLKNISSMTKEKDLLDIPEFLRRLSDKEKQEPKDELVPLKKGIIWPTQTEEKEIQKEEPKKVKPKVDIPNMKLIFPGPWTLLGDWRQSRLETGAENKQSSRMNQGLPAGYPISSAPRARRWLHMWLHKSAVECTKYIQEHVYLFYIFVFIYFGILGIFGNILIFAKVGTVPNFGPLAKVGKTLKQISGKTPLWDGPRCEICRPVVKQA